MGTSTVAPKAVEIRRTFTAPREKVFQAWIEPRMLSRWFLKPTPQHQPKMLHFDPHTRGGFRFEIVSPENGKLYVLAGAFTEIQPPQPAGFHMALGKRAGISGNRGDRRIPANGRLRFH